MSLVTSYLWAYRCYRRQIVPCIEGCSLTIIMPVLVRNIPDNSLINLETFASLGNSNTGIIIDIPIFSSPVQKTGTLMPMNRLGCFTRWCLNEFLPKSSPRGIALFCSHNSVWGLSQVHVKQQQMVRQINNELVLHGCRQIQVILFLQGKRMN